jgi:hypothetical protein
MAAGIVYLDVDDEITSAAQRIRSAPGTRVALVVPHGSRIATSRMNFRLLSREATIGSKRLSIVSADAASRALAVSAGLPVFGSVGEYEGSLGRPDDDAAGGSSRDVAGARGGAGGAGRAVDRDDSVPDESGSGSGAEGLAGSETVVTPPASRKSQRPRRPGGDTVAGSGEAGSGQGTLALGSAVAGAGAAAGTAAANIVDADAVTTRIPVGTRPQPRASTTPRQERDGAPALRDDDEDSAAGEAMRGRRRLATPVLAVLAVLGLAVIVLAVGAYLLLPSATIALTPRREEIGPIRLTVSADPTATEVDPVRGVVPAVRLEVPVDASQTFTTTGKRVETEAARGEVTFTNYDFTSQNTIVAGSVVSTEGGVRFRTLATVTLPPATFVIPTSVPSRRTVAVEAVKKGPEGNVAANSIRFVPQGENPEFLKVNNGAPTDGGTRTETPEVSEEEVADAVATVTADLGVAFDQAIADGAGAPEGTTLFPETATLSDPVPEVDPKELIGDAVESFDITLTATGSVVAVDPRPVRTIAETQLQGQIGADHRLVEGSVEIDVGEGTVGEDGQVTFLASARAARVLIVDPATLRPLVINRTAADAEAAVAPYGTAQVTLWPDWATTVTAVDSRLTITVEEGRDAPRPSPSTRPAASRSPTTRPSATAAGSDAGASDAPASVAP